MSATANSDWPTPENSYHLMSEFVIEVSIHIFTKFEVHTVLNDKFKRSAHQSQLQSHLILTSPLAMLHKHIIWVISVRNLQYNTANVPNIANESEAQEFITTNLTIYHESSQHCFFLLSIFGKCVRQYHSRLAMGGNITGLN